MKPLLLVLALVGLTACRRDVNVNVRVDTSAVEAPAPDPVPPASPDAPPTPTPASDVPVLSERGVGAVRIGMSQAAAEAVLGALHPLASIDETGACRYLNPTGTPAGVSFMVLDGIVVRADVSPFDMADSVPAARLPRTAAGVGVGSTQAEVEAAYGGRLHTEPHHYVPGGRYLVVTPAADTSRRVIFETDAEGRVSAMRAGRRPEVEWIEGCA